MPRLPRVSGQQAVRAFERAGWEVARRESSHVVLVKAGSSVTLSVPDHDELGLGLLRKLIRLSGMTVDQFTMLLEK